MKPRVILSGSHGYEGDTRLSAGDSHHLVSVLRLRPGNTIEVVVPGTGVFNARITGVEDGRARVRLGEMIEGVDARESPFKIHVVMPFLKGDRTEWAVQKAVEAGAAGFSIVVMDRGVVRPGPGGVQRRVQRLRRVVEAACKQSGRVKVPMVDGFQNLREKVYTEGRVLVMDPAAESGLGGVLRTGVTGLVVVSGPEGGFSDAETDWFRGRGWQGFSLGPRVLRAETAVVAGVVALQVMMGDMG